MSYGFRDLWREVSMTYYFWTLLCGHQSHKRECIGEAGKGAINISLSLPHMFMLFDFWEEEHLYKALLVSIWLCGWKAK